MMELKQVPDLHGLPSSLALLLARRGYEGESLERYLDPDMACLSDWRRIGGMEEVAGRIASAVRGSEMILVHGDYDADGITATAVVYLALKSLGARVDYFIPDRFDDGYGLGESSIQACLDAGAELMVTVDCGISDSEHVRVLAGMGVDTVITDHHQPGEEVPPAVAVVDPAMDDGAHYADLAGVGVAWMAMKGVFDLLGGDPEYLHTLLQLVAVGTVADVVELTGDNRILVSEGMAVLRREPFPGIEAVSRSASIDIRRATSTDLAYYIGPRLNACGRIGHAHEAVRLLLASEEDDVNGLAAKVDANNRLRRKLDGELEEQVLRRTGDPEGRRCIVMADGDWHRGVIGIVASRLVARFGVPALLIALEDGMGFGSARSVPGIPIHSILSDIQFRLGIMESLGGHPMAAGFRVIPDNVPWLREELCKVMTEDRWDRYLGSVVYIDGRLEEEDYSAGMARALDLMEPFGQGNRMPVWIARGAYPVTWKPVGRDGKHLSCSFRLGSGTVRAIGFNMADRQSMFSGRVDLAFTLSLDTWRNDGSVQLVLKDIRKHRSIEP
ncbi:MAG: single-stranded-DNA-specific exonuclease RecJ [Candidatus Fermentibacteraceae bacterium]|nr:single-stranded-DNA-specific exonuclease RecJ [Candidatus Fermentibacteraceae bacterium]